MSEQFDDPQPPTGDPSSEIAAPDIQRVRDPWAQYLDMTGITPARVADIMAAARAGDAREFLEYTEQILERNPAASAHWLTFRTDLHGIPLQVHPAADDERSQEIAEWVRVNVVDQENFQQLRWDLIDGLWRGYSVVEMSFDTANAWEVSFDWKPPQWFVFDRATGKRLLLRSNVGKPDGMGNIDMGEELPEGRFICFAPRLKTGLIVRSGLAWPVMAMDLFASFAMRYWMALAEGHGRPFRFAEMAQGAGAKAWADAKRALRQMGYNASAVFEAGTKVHFPDAKIEGHSDFHSTLSDFLAGQIAIIILGSNFMNESGGSNAKATVLGERLDNRTVWGVQRLDACLNEQLVKLMCRIEFGDLEAYPEVHAMTDPPEDAASVALSYFNVSKALGKPLPVREADMRKRLGWNEPEEGDRLAGGDEWTTEGKPALEDVEGDEQARRDMRDNPPDPGGFGGDGDGDGDD